MNELAQTARVSGCDPMWERLAVGGLTEQELAALELAAENDADTRLAVELFRPLDDSFKRRMVRMARQSARPADRPALRWGARQVTAISMGAAASVAAWVLYTGRPAPTDEELPEYIGELRGFVVPTRSDEPAAAVAPALIEHGTTVVLLGRPVRQVEGGVTVVLMAVFDGQRHTVTPRVEIADSGAFRLRVDVTELFETYEGPAVLRAEVRSTDDPTEVEEVEWEVRVQASAPSPSGIDGE